MSKKIRNKLEKILPDWNINYYNERDGCGFYELESWSPAGENIIITLYGASFAELAADASEARKCFDIDKHAAEILIAKRTGDENTQRFYAAAPNSLIDLIQDAKKIDKMYLQVIKELEKASRNERKK